MHLISTLTFLLPHLAGQALAQAVKYETFLYNRAGCASADPNDPDLKSLPLTIFEESGIWNDPDNQSCRVASVQLQSWNEDPNKAGNYVAWIDGVTIPSDCYLLFFRGPPPEEEVSETRCSIYERRLDSGTGCTQQSFGPKLAYALCCGSSSKCLPGARKRAFPPPTIPASLPPRDVTAIKRAPILSSHNHNTLTKRDCKFISTDPSLPIHFGEQQTKGDTVSCPADAGEPCSLDWQRTVGSSRSTSFSVGVEIGGPLFKAITGSVSFETTYTKEDTESYSFTVNIPVPPGASGYLTWSPRLQCAVGHFEGCDGVGTEEGRACYQTYEKVGEGKSQPRGTWNFLRLN